MRLLWPLTGRSAAMRSIHTAIDAGDLAGIVIGGPAGVGKSRIARQALSDAKARGFEGRWVVGATSAAKVPLGAFTVWAPPAVTDTVHLLRGVIASLTAAPSGAPILICVDDAHLLDDLSAFVVHQIVQRGAAKVVLTLRDGEPVPPAVEEITAAGQFDRLDLAPLTPDETTSLLAATLGGTVDPDTGRRLWTLTRGNVLYLRNIVEREVADGRIVSQRGCWRWVGDPVMPPGLVQLIESRMGALPASVDDVIDVLAVGEPIALAALERIVDAAAVEEAESRGLVVLEPVMGGVQVRLTHPLYGEVRRRRAPATRLRRFRGLVATELARSADADDIGVLVRRATLSLESDLPVDADLLVKASYGAVWLADLHLADRLAAAAVGAGAEPNFIRAHALSWLGRGEEADAVLAAIPPDGLSDVERGKLAFLRASNMLWSLADPVRAKQLVDDAARDVSAQARGYIDAFLTVYWFAMDHPDQASRIAKKLAVKELPAIVGAEIAWVLTVIDADAGRLAEAVAIADTGYAVAARSLDAPQMRFNIADAHVGALLLAGRIDQAGAVAAGVRRQAADLPGVAQTLGAAVAARVELAAGHVDTAAAGLGDAAAALSESGHATGWGYRYGLPYVMALAMRGDLDEADTALSALQTLRRPFRALHYERALARAWVAAASGAVTEAIATVTSAAQKAREVGQYAAEVLCLQTAAQFGDSTGAARLAELETVVQGPRVRLAARFAAGLRDGDAEGLSLVSTDFEEMGDRVAAADAAAHAALAHRYAGRRGSALTCASRATALADECGGLATPALRHAVTPLPLTEREREIVMLIGAGLSNRAIAQRLTLSVRTVESHIYQAMSKTGTATREQLAALLPTSVHRAAHPVANAGRFDDGQV
ncbi:helix-turn-helix transcriptional regulator [Mycolicibacterium goodii]|uniref:helix-turn-helix transcriptional regulator n=1 Tax=Mycolicibacterium goodii TaxID=134601 RepID=UPI0009FA4F8A